MLFWSIILTLNGGVPVEKLNSNIASSPSHISLFGSVIVKVEIIGLGLILINIGFGNNEGGQ